MSASPPCWPGRATPGWLKRTMLVLSVALLLTALGAAPRATHAAPGNLAQNRPVTVSSSENPGVFPGSAAVDGNSGTRWASAFSDPQWIQIDLGSSQAIGRVVLSWEAAFGRAYQIQTSPTGSTWTTIYATTTGDGGTDDLLVSGSGRYIRLNATQRGTAYGYSLWEFEVYAPGGPTATPTRTATPAPSATPIAGTNLARGKIATASTSENAASGPGLAVDGNAGTRWSSTFSDPQWIQIDLGATATIARVVLRWEAAFGRAYQIQTSPNGSTWTTIYATTTGDGGVDDLVISGSGRYIRLNATQRGTAYGYSLWEFEVYGSGGATPTPTPTPPGGDFWGDTSNIPPANNELMFKFLNRTNGRFSDSEIFWSFNGETHSIAERPYFDMPVNSAGRMYFYLGSPNSQYSDFIEFTIGPNMFNGNTTRVDWFGIKLAMRLRAEDGYDVAVGENLATFQEDRAATFQRFVNAMPAEFKHLGQIQAPYRIPAPGKMGETEFLPNGRYANYFTSYASSVGISASIFDILACAGPLANDAARCAALNRHVAHLPQSQWSDPRLFYQAAPANYYAKFWHDNSINALAYGFPYDDYADQSSFITHANPQYLLVAIGW
ncbi:MAG TPA: discoidin domain-containing protein [Roseiflexaceae bacterium]|nr:discoidin domain-containing protein [Roseiflexaceae bacterium]